MQYYAIYVGIAVALAICCLCCYFLRSFVHKCLIAMENMIGKCIYAIAIPIKGSISVFQFVFYYIKETCTLYMCEQKHTTKRASVLSTVNVHVCVDP